MSSWSGQPVIQKKALLIGLNYPNTNHNLDGCWNDVDLLKKMLVDKYGYDENNILVMKDNGTDADPTANNIFKSLDWLICPICDPDDWNNCKHYTGGYLGDDRKLFFSFSGHGTQFKDDDGDEKDGYDEAIYCKDYCITDDMLYKWFISKFPKRDNLVCCLDCCNSGTMLDLKTSYHPGTRDDKVVLEMNAGRQEVNSHIKMISGCRDEQTSADAYIELVRKYQGALTHGLVEILSSEPKINIGNLCNKVNKYMKDNGYSQRPVISVDGGTLPYESFMN